MSLDSRVDYVMNAAVSYLEESNLPVTPESQLEMCQSWYMSLMDSTDEVGIQNFDALGAAIDRLRKNIELITQP